MKLTVDYEVPDKCPEGCPFTDDIMDFGQNAICGRCPVFVCANYPDCGPLVPPEDYRPDWAKAWSEFFAGGMKEYPHLPLNMEG